MPVDIRMLPARTATEPAVLAVRVTSLTLQYSRRSGGVLNDRWVPVLHWLRHRSNRPAEAIATQLSQLLFKFRLADLLAL